MNEQRQQATFNLVPSTDVFMGQMHESEGHREARGREWKSYLLSFAELLIQVGHLLAKTGDFWWEKNRKIALVQGAKRGAGVTI